MHHVPIGGAAGQTRKRRLVKGRRGCRRHIRRCNKRHLTLVRSSALFEEPNLVSEVGLVSVMRLTANAGPGTVTDRWLSFPTNKGDTARGKVAYRR